MPEIIHRLYSIFLRCPKICTDTRNIVKGGLFFALRGSHHNGNRFATEALRKGCSYAVIDDPHLKNDSRFILVKDALKTLQELALYHRKQLSIPIIAITGSNGKTTTKEIIRCVLGRKFNVFATTGNLNNHIGLPLTLLSVSPAHEIAVLEMGANHVGEIKALCEIARPTHGIITNIGKAHLGEFGGEKGVKEAKKELYDFIRKHRGTVFVNADDPLLYSMSEKINRIIYSQHIQAYCRVTISKTNPVCVGTIKTGLYGKHNAQNLMAAVCVGAHFGVKASDIQESLHTFQPAENRGKLVRTDRNILLLDAYNANPTNIEAALESFVQRKGKNKMVILGDMLELGKYGAGEHLRIAQLAGQHHFIKVILVGKNFSRVRNHIRCLHFPDTEKTAAWLGKNPVSGAFILLKGSRKMRLEKLVSTL